MYRNFTRGLIAGTLIGTAVGMMMPSRTNTRIQRKVFKNGRHFIKRAGNIIESMMDMM